MAGKRRTRSQKSPEPKSGKATRAARAANNDPPSSPISPSASNTTRTRDPTPQPQIPPTPKATRSSARIRGQSAEPLVALPDITGRKRKAPATSQNTLDPIEDEEDGEASPSKKAKLEHTAESEAGEVELYEEHIENKDTDSPIASIPSPNYNGASASQASPTDDDIDDLLRTARRDSEIHDTPRSPVEENAEDVLEQPESQPYNSPSPIHDIQSSMAPTSPSRKCSASLESLNEDAKTKRQKSAPIESPRPTKSPRQSSTESFLKAYSPSARMASRRASQKIASDPKSSPWPLASAVEDASTSEQPTPSHTDAQVITLSDTSSEHSYQEDELRAASSSLELEAPAPEQLMQCHTDKPVVGLSNTGMASQEDQIHADSSAIIETHTPDQLLQSHADQHVVAPPAPTVAAFEQVSQADQTQPTSSQSDNCFTYHIPQPRRPRIDYPEPIDYDNPKVNAWEAAEDAAYEIGLGTSPSSRKKPFRITIPPKIPTMFIMEKFSSIYQDNISCGKETVHIDSDSHTDTLWKLAKLFEDREKGESVDATEIISKLEELSKPPPKVSSDEVNPMFEYHFAEIARERGEVYQRPADRITQTPRAPTAAAQETQSASRAARRLGTPKARTSAPNWMKSAGPASRSTRTPKSSSSAVQETQSAAPASRSMRRPRVGTSSVREHRAGSSIDTLQSADSVHSRPATDSRKTAGSAAPNATNRLSKSISGGMERSESRNHRTKEDFSKNSSFAASSAPSRLSKYVSGATERSETNDDEASSTDETGMAPGEEPLRDVTGLYPQALVCMNNIREGRGWKLRYPIPPEFLAELEEQQAKRKQAWMDRRQPSRIPADDDDDDDDYMVNTSSRMGTGAGSDLGYSQSQSLYGAPSRSPVKRAGPPTKPVETFSIVSRVFQNESNTPTTSIHQPVSTATSSNRSISTNEQPRPRYRHKRKHNAGPMDRGYFHIGPELMMDTDDEYESEWEGPDGILVEDLPKSTMTVASARKTPKKADQRSQQKAPNGYGLSDSEDEADDKPAPLPIKTPLKGILKKPANKNATTPYEKKSVSMAVAEKGPLTETPGNKRPHSATFANTLSTTPRSKRRIPTQADYDREGIFWGYGRRGANEGKKQMEDLQNLEIEGKSENEDPQQVEIEGQSQNEDLQQIRNQDEDEDEDEDQGINDIRKEVNMLSTRGTEIRPEIAAKVSQLPVPNLDTAPYYAEMDRLFSRPEEWSEHPDSDSKPFSGRA